MRASGTTHENLDFAQVTGTGYDSFNRRDFNSLTHASHQAIDGNNLPIGAFGEDTNGGNVGQVYGFSAAVAVPETTTHTLFGVARAEPVLAVR